LANDQVVCHNSAHLHRARKLINMGKQTPYSKTVPPERREELYRNKMRAAELKRHGHTYEDIAGQMGVPKSTVFSWIRSLMKEHQSLAFDEIALYRQESLDRLTELLKVQMVKALDGDDKATTQCRLLISQIDDLTGAKAPVKVEIGESDVDRAIRELEAELDRRVAGAAGEAGPVQEPASPDHPG
jgi:transposase-like protein